MDTNTHSDTDNNLDNAIGDTPGDTMNNNNNIDNSTNSITNSNTSNCVNADNPNLISANDDTGNTGNNNNNSNNDSSDNSASSADNSTDALPPTKPDYYKLAEEHPEQYRIFKNGAIYNNKTGRIVAVDNSKNAHAITKETSQDMHKQRANLRIQAQISARSGIADHLRKPTALAAWADIVGSQAERAIDPEFSRSTEAARFVGVATGFMVDRGSAEAGKSGSGSTIINVFGDELAETLMRIAAEETARRAVEAEGEGGIVEGEYRDAADGDNSNDSGSAADRSS